MSIETLINAPALAHHKAPFFMHMLLTNPSFVFSSTISDDIYQITTPPSHHSSCLPTPNMFMIMPPKEPTSK